MNGELIEDFRWLAEPADSLLVLAIAAALTVTLLAAAGLAWRARRQRQRGLPFFKPTPPHVRALKALAALTLEDDLEFVKQVSLVVRVYIQERFGLRAPHRSTEEFLREAQRSALLEDEHQQSLGVFLSQCDLVKFARHHADVEQMQELLDSARHFVEATIKEEQA
jgi:hypothetical protein